MKPDETMEDKLRKLKVKKEDKSKYARTQFDLDNKVTTGEWGDA